MKLFRRKNKVDIYTVTFKEVGIENSTMTAEMDGRSLGGLSIDAAFEILNVTKKS